MSKFVRNVKNSMKFNIYVRPEQQKGVQFVECLSQIGINLKYDSAHRERTKMQDKCKAATDNIC